MILISFERALQALYFDVFITAHGFMVAIETYGGPKMPWNRILVFNLVYRISYRSPMVNVLIMGTKCARSPEVVRTFFS